jgi:hypothetical protein
MSKTFDQGKEEVAKLCQHFTTNRQAFLAPGVKEAHICQMLIEPFFEALGWDVRSAAMVAPQYREVIPQDSLDVEGQQKAPDYTFRVGTLPKFYAEAKKCGVNISADPAPAYQLRRYGWSAKLALSILTDFEELAVYDCTVRPKQSDKASHARVLHFGYQEYPDRWRELWDLFSREAVWSGAFDQYAASKRKRGTSEVDVEFLKEIEGWRDVLARNIAMRNKDVSSDDLNAAVQSTIDRVVFLRMAEDRGLEPSEQLLKLCEQGDIYPRFMRDLCRKADDKYNSGLFHFHKEQETDEDPDRITPKLTVDDRVFKPILQSLYFAHGSPYHFGLLPVEILGTVYERFLGKVIRLTAGHQAKVEEKPEVRKAGGVYYTPAYIVDYIVNQTLGRQIDGRSPMQLAGLRNGRQPFRVLDMACGSGSFLLGAFRCLLDHCFDWYLEHDPKKHKKAIYKDPHNGQWRLTIEEKKRILTTHVFGVDIDAQAVEVSKLSLLLKVLEGETDESFQLGLLPFSDRALPNLAENIKCGNSLIGPDYFTGKLIPDAEEMKRVNAFDWKQGFPAAIKAGGFDCVIGNPPWLVAGYYVGDEIEYMRERFQSAQGKFDLYYLFLENALRLTGTKGCVGMIVPNKFFHTKAATELRRLLADGKCLEEVVDFGDSRVFHGPTNYSCIVRLARGSRRGLRYFRTKAGFAEQSQIAVARSRLTAEPWHFEERRKYTLFRNMERIGTPLENLVSRFGTGVQSGADRILVIEPRLARKCRLEKELLRRILRGRNVRRYAVRDGARLLVFPYKVERGNFAILSETELRKHKRVYRLLSAHRHELESRVWFGKDANELAGEWYGMMYLDSYRAFSSQHILTPSLSNRANFALGQGTLFATGTAGVTSIIRRDDVQEDVLYLLGLLNSRLLSFYAIAHSPVFSGAYYKFSAPYLKRLPIRRIDLSDRADKTSHDRMVQLVDSMLELHKRLAAAKSEAQKTVIQRQIDATDAEIDRLVYDLYGLSAEEVAIVEETAK